MINRILLWWDLFILNNAAFLYKTIIADLILAIPLVSLLAGIYIAIRILCNERRR